MCFASRTLSVDDWHAVNNVFAINHNTVTIKCTFNIDIYSIPEIVGTSVNEFSHYKGQASKSRIRYTTKELSCIFHRFSRFTTRFCFNCL